MQQTLEPHLTTARSAADRAAALAGVRVRHETDLLQLRAVADLLIDVWGTARTSPPIPADLLRSIGHAGSAITAAYSADGVLCGAAVAICTDRPSSLYSLVAGVLPAHADAGVGFALKQHQRAWAIEGEVTTMTWTFDPLVSRNARFNLTKLGARASEYAPDFYGPLDDGLNAGDETDRLVAVWPLTAAHVVASGAGVPDDVELPGFAASDVLRAGPDGDPVLVRAAGSLWCRVPVDIVALRRRDAATAAQWRGCIREVLTSAFADGFAATGVTRTGWYRLEREASK